MSKELLIVSTSLNPASNSRMLAECAFGAARHLDGAAAYVDLRDYNLPVCDGESAYSHERLPELTALIAGARAVIIACPVYNYAAGATAKNLIELTGDAWKEKVVGFALAAGGKYSYMAVMGLANSLMLDFRCLVNPRFVYADASAFADGRLADATVSERIDELVASTLLISRALAARD